MTRHQRVRHFVVVIAVGFLASVVLAFGQGLQPNVPQWQIDAGGSATFEVASIKQDKSTAAPHSNIPMGPGNGRITNGGLFSVTNFPLVALIGFAYQLTGSQIRDLQSRLPKWTAGESFDIAARSSASGLTKDQLRLMMQSLLVQRFKMASHYETRNTPVLALVSNKRNKLGPQLRLHRDDLPCLNWSQNDTGSTVESDAVQGGFPAVCGELLQLPSGPVPGRYRFGGRNMTSVLLVSSLNAIADVERPIIDQTGLTGTFDFTVEFTLQIGPSAQSDDTGPSFRESLRDQLGLTLIAETRAIPSALH